MIILREQFYVDCGWGGIDNQHRGGSMIDMERIDSQHSVDPP